MTGILCLLFAGILGVDLSNESNKGFLLQNIIKEVEARGCGVNQLNHQTWKQGGKVCYGSSGDPTDFTILPYNDCKDEWNSCCPMPDDQPTCPSIGG